MLAPRKALGFLNSRIVTPNILEETFHSCTPYSFGNNQAIKWAVQPLKTITDVMPDHPGENFLRERLIEDLSPVSKNEVAFELFVQFQDDEAGDSIDDSAVPWKGKFHKVATLKMASQDLNSSERILKDQRMNFCPAQTIREHAPLGTVNLIRAQVYTALALERKKSSEPGQTRFHKTLPQETQHV
ncbi:MAG: hypothetical protein EOP09_00325 [Proteobacteria bacterium]|nr:MAG: hypothetical protein EOP09_00325 [Pseudomonadota bacterium]